MDMYLLELNQENIVSVDEVVLANPNSIDPSALGTDHRIKNNFYIVILKEVGSDRYLLAVSAPFK
jgi:hypothetical protein